MARKIHKLTRICCPDSNVQHLHVNKVAQQTLQRSPALRESVRHVALDDSKVCVQEANNTQLNQLAADAYVLYSEVSYPYTPSLGYVLTGTIWLNQNTLFFPRLATQITAPTSSQLALCKP